MSTKKNRVKRKSPPSLKRGSSATDRQKRRRPTRRKDAPGKLTHNDDYTHVAIRPRGEAQIFEFGLSTLRAGVIKRLDKERGKYVCGYDLLSKAGSQSGRGDLGTFFKGVKHWRKLIKKLPGKLLYRLNV
jgi:hypothetical protein